LVFVLGHIGYYPRAGFGPALPFGRYPPCAIDPAVADAWMVRELRPGILGAVRGSVRCADALMRHEPWRECEPVHRGRPVLPLALSPG
jgi:predicted N-acetyltransferase YhbS